MNRAKSNLGWKLIILLIVSAAFILARFSLSSAEELTDPAEPAASALSQNSPDMPVSPLLDGEKPQNESLVGPLLKLLFALIVVVAGLYGFLILLKRMMGSKYSGNRGNRLIETLATTYVAQKKSVSLVRFGERAVLLGVADDSISVLAELSKDETGKILAESTVGSGETTFNSVLTGAREKMKAFDLKRLTEIWIPKKADRPQAV